MDKIIIVDGNSLMFRSYYATSYTGNLMQNKKGLYTNALFGFCNMFNKILEDNPNYIFVAFDAGKQTFRHQSYDGYKGGRKELPDELRVQIPYIKKYLDILNIKREESIDYEADDLIATVTNLAKKANLEVKVISGDKDLLQLVDKNVNVYMTKSGVKELEEYNVDNFYEKMGFTPLQVIDYKGLVGDSSDNLPGIKGIGPKTAIKLLNEYKTLENIYDHIDELKGKTKILFEESKDIALKCKYLATLVNNIDLKFTLDELNYQEPNNNELYSFFKEMEFETFLKKLSQKKNEKSKKLNDYIFIDDDCSLNNELNNNCIFITEIFKDNYYNGQVLGMAILINDKKYFFSQKSIIINTDLKNYLENSNYKKSTFDYKRSFVALNKFGIKVLGLDFDLMLASYIINPASSSDDFKKAIDNYIESDIDYLDNIYGSNTKIKIPEREIYIQYALDKCNYIKEHKEYFINKIKNLELDYLFNVEMQLSYVLGNMELNGLKVNSDKLHDIGVDLSMKAEDIADKIFTIAKCEFNLNSPKQIGDILFEKLNLPHSKKNKTGYSTSVDVLEKLSKDYEIASLILEYRAYTKIINTYVNGLKGLIDNNGQVHPLYKQALTVTGRLSSVEPNIQNIPTRTEVGQVIREAFVSRFPNGVICSADYSQIELRVLAHMSSDETMISSFKSGKDFHSKTASEMYGISFEEVTKDLRRTAKAINFGIIYGMSAWGLSESINVSPKQADEYIKKYFETYKCAKDFLDKLISDCRSLGYTKTIFNRRRYIEEINGQNQMMRNFGERTAMNAPIQGSAADIIKIAMVDVYKKLEENNYKSKLIAQVHDELVFDCVNEEAESIIQLVKTTMENAVTLKVPLIVEVGCGKSWLETK